MSTYRDALRYTVRRTPDGGTAAVDTSLEVLQVFESAGGKNLDYAVLELDLAKVSTRYANWTEPPYIGDEIEIEHVPSGSVVHWGKVTKAQPRLSGRGESIRLVSRLDPYHVGGRVDGIYHFDPSISDAVLIGRDMVFNPVIDGRVVGNRHQTESLFGNPARVFLDPEAVRTAASQTLYGATAVPWTISEAVEYLLWALNPLETYVTNPTLAQIRVNIDDSTAELSDVKIDRGLYLSEALDKLLAPLGYRWKIDRQAGSRIFDFFRRGSTGSTITVKHQAAGADLNLIDSNASDVALDFDVSGLANEVEAQGGYYQYEMTVELLRAWPASQDSLADGDGEELVRSHPNFDDHPEAYRKWVLNESGDYIGLRTEIDGVLTSDLRTALTGLSLLDDFHPPRRRRLLPTLTLGPDNATPIGKIRGIEVEYSNPLAGGGGEPDWLPLANTTCEILEHEAGIYLSGDRLPEELLGQGTGLQMRATFSIETDYRLLGFAARQTNSPQVDVVPAVLDVADRFKYRQVLSVSKYHADVNGGSPTKESLQANDSAAIAAWAAYARDTFDLRSIEGRVTLDSLDWHVYELGQRVSQLQGRNVSFAARTGTTTYPQIVAIERNVESQKTVLHLERFKPPMRG